MQCDKLLPSECEEVTSGDFVIPDKCDVFLFDIICVLVIFKILFDIFSFPVLRICLGVVAGFGVVGLVGVVRVVRDAGGVRDARGFGAASGVGDAMAVGDGGFGDAGGISGAGGVGNARGSGDAMEVVEEVLDMLEVLELSGVPGAVFLFLEAEIDGRGEFGNCVCRYGRA